MAERWDCFLPQRHLAHPDRYPHNHRHSFPRCLFSWRPPCLSFLFVLVGPLLSMVLPKRLSAFTPAASHTLRGWDSSACHTRTPILQKKKQGPQGWWGEMEAGGDQGRQGLWWGAFVRVPRRGARLWLDEAADCHRLSLPSEPPAPLRTQVSPRCCPSAEPVGRLFRGLGWALGDTPEVLDLSGPRWVTYWESHSPFGLHWTPLWHRDFGLDEETWTQRPPGARQAVWVREAKGSGRLPHPKRDWNSAPAS